MGTGMLKNLHVPETRHLRQIADNAAFPATVRQLRRVAHRLGFAGGMLKFLSLFSDEEHFTNREDFLVRCQYLALVIREEREL